MVLSGACFGLLKVFYIAVHTAMVLGFLGLDLSIVRSKRAAPFLGSGLGCEDSFLKSVRRG